LIVLKVFGLGMMGFFCYFSAILHLKLVTYGDALTICVLYLAPCCGLGK
jgi:hypothetical protein